MFIKMAAITNLILILLLDSSNKMDRLTKEQRHKNMSNVKNKDTDIEILLRKALWHKGIRYRKNYRIYDCKPDIVISKYKIAIFCDGEFWHGRYLGVSDAKTNVKFWQIKIKRNQERDLENTIMLRDNGWCVLRFWSTDIKVNLESCISKILI